MDPTNLDQVRNAQLEINKRDDDNITVSASLSSDAPIDMGFGIEVLDHSADAVDLSRAEPNGLPLLWNHDPGQPIGRIKNLKLDKGKLRGDLTFSNNTKAREVAADVEGGFLTDMSIGYRVKKYEETDELLRATDWYIYEGSIATIAADPSVGINRNKTDETKGVIKMDPKDEKTGEGEKQVIDFTQARELAKNEGRADGIRQERERAAGIRALFVADKFQGPGFDQLRETAINNEWSIDKTRQELLNLVGGDVQPVNDAGQRDKRPSIERGKDEYDKFTEAAELSLAVRGGIETDKEKVRLARSTGLMGLTLMELSREYLHKNNVNTQSMGRRELAGQVFIRSLVSHGTSDFVNILANVAEKAALVGWTEAPETWNIWAKTGSLSDFKTADRSGLGEFPDLDLVYENGGYKFATMNDRKEQLKLATYGKKISFSRESLINDDLGEFTTIPRKMGRAANRKVGDVAYEVLTSNPTLNQDSTTLFHANHNNIGTTGLPSKTTYDELFKLMKLQKDNDSNAHGLNIVPRYIIAPVALEATIDELNVNQYDPAGTAGTLKKNPYAGRMTPVTDPRLDATSATGWYALADQNLNDTIEVAFLDGQQAPYLEQVQGGDQDGVIYKVRIDAVAGALGYQGAFYNAGA